MSQGVNGALDELRQAITAQRGEIHGQNLRLAALEQQVMEMHGHLTRVSDESLSARAGMLDSQHAVVEELRQLREALQNRDRQYNRREDESNRLANALTARISSLEEKFSQIKFAELVDQLLKATKDHEIAAAEALRRAGGEK